MSLRCILAVTLLLRPAFAAPPSPDAVSLQAAVNRAIAARAPSFTLPPGNIFFNDSPFLINGASDFAIGGSGTTPTTLIFGPSFGVSIENGTRVALHDVVIDYSPLPYVYAVITAAAAKTLNVTLAPSSLTFEDFIATYPPHDIWPPVSVFDGATSDLVRPVCSWGRPAPATHITGRDYVIACGDGGGAVKPGDVLVAPTRVGFTLTLSRTAACTVTDVTLYAASSMAVTEFLGDGGNVYTRLRIVPRNSSRPLASNADGFHSSGMRAGPRLVNSEISNLLDDYFNVHSTFQVLVATSSPHTVLVGDYQLFPGGNSLYGTQRTLDVVQPGDALSFFPLNTFSYPALASSTIASIVRVPDDASSTALLAAAYANASAVAVVTPCSACRRGLNPYSTAQLWQVTLVDNIAVAPPLFVNADSVSAAGAVIDSCVFANSGSNVGRFKSTGGRIINSTWRNTVSQNLEIAPLQNWLEGPLGLHNITVANCTFHGTAENPIHVFGATDVRESGNSFLPSPVESSANPDTALVQAHVAAHASETFRQPSGYIKFPYLVPAGPYDQLWDWDSMFCGIALRSYGATPYFVGSFKSFLSATNLSNGELPGCITPKGPSATLYHAKPLIIQAAYLAAKQDGGNVAQFSVYGDAMRALLRYWNSSTRLDSATGLHMWHDQLESGADNNVMSECPSPYSPECWTPSQAYTLASPDIMVWLSREYHAYALFVEGWGALGGCHLDVECGGTSPLYSSDWQAEAAGARAAMVALADALNEHLLVCEDSSHQGCYYGGYNVSTRTLIRARTFQAALPVWAGLAPNASIAAAALDASLAEDLSSPYGLRSTSSRDPRYSNANMINPYSNWRGPVWINVGMLNALGLRANGRGTAATALADALVHTLAEDLRATGTWHESYDSESGLGLAAPAFLSWDTLGASMQGDVATGVDPFALE